jgi:copper transport protein
LVRRTALALALVTAAALSLVMPSAAGAHAVLVGSEPERGAALERPPGEVVFRFNEPVEIAFGALRVFDAQGRQVESGDAEHPGGDARAVAVDVPRDLPDGSYTATYRVVSADAHPVSGGFVFSVGEGGAAARPVAELLDDQGAGPVTDAAFGAAKAVSYAAIALAVGAALFLAAVWMPALREVGGADDAWRLGSEAFADRVRLLVLAAAGAGVVATAAGIVLQGATAGGTSAWRALDPEVIGDVLSTRFGTVWGIRLLDWLLIGALAVAVLGRSALPALRPASLGAAGLAARRLGSPPLVLVAALLLGYLVISPALSGHASTSDPAVVLVPANVVHVLAMSAWAGGLAVLVIALPAATRRLDPSDRTRLLAACLRRFSPLALMAVAILLATGVIQSLFQLDALGDLTGTAFGRAILAKAILLAGLICLGAWNRNRSLPRLRRAAAEGRAPGGEGHVLRRTLRAEVVLIAGALAATAALTSYPPPDSLADGPFAATGRLGAARLELAVDPAQVGSNEIHLYLTNPRTGAQYDRFREIALQLRLPSKQVGPLEPRVDKAGPGHWVSRRAQVVPAGEWRLTIAGRVSEFDEHRAVFEVDFR